MLRTSALAILFAETPFAQQPCENLTKLALPHSTVSSAALVAATAEIPAHCDVKATTRPTSDCEIGFELWLPSCEWNGKYQQVGNGGWAGNIPLVSFAEPLKRGFARAPTRSYSSALRLSSDRTLQRLGRPQPGRELYLQIEVGWRFRALL